jgi:hypothetical protein
MPPAADDSPSEFSSAFSAAIAERGMTLTELRSRLRARGVAVSLATLSYWQRGSRVPRGPASMEAVEAIEEILRLDGRQLVGKIRGRRPGRPGAMTTYTEFEDTPVVIDEALAQLGLLRDFGLDEISAHLVVTVDGEGRVRSAANRQVLRAVEEGAQRMPAVLLDDFAFDAPPRIDALRGCRLGRRIDHPEHAVSVVEIVLDAPLAYGGMAIIETELHFPPNAPQEGVDDFGYHLTRRLRECAIWVQFTPGVVPGFGEAHTQTADLHRRPVPSLLSKHDLQAVVHGFGPGRLWLRWEW